MRNRNFDPYSFFRELDHHLALVAQDGVSLRNQVVDNPTFLEFEWYFRNLPTKLSEIEVLILISWWLPEEVGILLRMQLEEKVSKLSLEDQVVSKILLSSKGEARCFLTETSKWTTRDFFGNVLPKGIRAYKNLKFSKKGLPKIRRPQRKRGYHDHGSLRPTHKWKPANDWSLTQEQNEIEKKRHSFSNLIKLFKGLIT